MQSIRDIKTRPEYAFSNLQCRCAAGTAPAPGSQGRIVRQPVSGTLSFYYGGGKVCTFELEEKEKRDALEEIFCRNTENLAEVSPFKSEEMGFVLDAVFFLERKQMGDLNIVLDSSVAEKKKLSNPEAVRRFQESFLCSDGTQNCYLVTTGPSNSGGVESGMRLYGSCGILHVRLVEPETGGEPYLYAVGIQEQRGNLPMLAVGAGNIRFSDQRSYLTEAIRKEFTETPEYLRIWEEYAQQEGTFLLCKARAVGQLYSAGSVSYGSDGEVELTVMEIPEALSKEDRLEFTAELPVYLEDPDMTWEDYCREKDCRIKGSAPRQQFYVQKIDRQNRILTLRQESPQSVAGINGTYLVYSIASDEVQIRRRDEARRRISNANCANPEMGLIIQGKRSASAVRKQTHIALSTPIRRKLFSQNAPNAMQEKAISVALNTPDIAIIQGPPGTGKTTVITAILEQLNEMDRSKNSAGRVLITGFQHDAVLNVIERLRINGIPTVKFGKRKNQEESEDPLESWSQEVRRELEKRNPALRETAQQQELKHLFSFYHDAPAPSRAISLLKYMEQICTEPAIQERIASLLEQLQQLSDDKQGQNLRRKIRALRTTAEGFADDGADKIYDLYLTLEGLWKNPREEQCKILEKLECIQDQADTGIVREAELQRMQELRTQLLTIFAPRTWFSPAMYERELLELFTALQKSMRHPADELETLQFLLYDTLQNDPKSIRDALDDFSYAYAATVQQSEGRELGRKKGLRDEVSHPEYDTVIVDEAARVNPGDLMIVMAQAAKKLILVGDHRQLPHVYNEEIFEAMQGRGQITEQNQQDIQHSMFEHLLNQARALEREDHICRTVTLNEQYRTHPLLGNFVSQNFYEPYGEQFRSPLDASYFAQPFYDKPLRWVNLPVRENTPAESKRGTSRQRLCEAQYIGNEILRVLRQAAGQKVSIGVITFYSAQVDAIRKKLSGLASLETDSAVQEGLNKVRVGSVDAFQGMEFDIIFLSAVRTTHSLPRHSAPNNKNTKNAGMRIFGFLTSENRLCVALSRQKKMLIVVGDGELFGGPEAGQYVPALKNFYDLCREEGAVQNG